LLARARRREPRRLARCGTSGSIPLMRPVRRWRLIVGGDHPAVRLLAGVALAWPAVSHAQREPVSRADSALVRRILSAEDRRNSTDAALKQGLQSQTDRIRVIANGAIGRIRDPRFVARDSLPALRAPMTWPEPAWRLRFRALTAQSNCGDVRAGLADSAWQVR